MSGIEFDLNRLSGLDYSIIKYFSTHVPPFTLIVKEVCFLLSVSSRHDHEDYGQYHHHYDNESSSSDGYEDDAIEGKGRTPGWGERERDREFVNRSYRCLGISR